MTFHCSMTRWKKDATEFVVKLSNDGSNSMSCRVPKPILEKLDHPDNLKFSIKKNMILISSD